jgi:glucose uptake protein
MLGILYALITVGAWGTWLTPSQNVRFRGQQVRTFYVAAANLVLALVVALVQGFDQITADVFWFPFLGGLIWALSAWCAFIGTKRLGMARAYGIWAPLNILVSLAAGAVLFREFMAFSTFNLLLLAGSLVMVVSGVLMIVLAKGSGPGVGQRRNAVAGLGGALAAGVLWGVYFIPVKLSQASLWVAAFPLACGIFAGSSLLMLLTRQSLRLERRSDYLRAGSTGALWTLGNYGMLLLVDCLGAGQGYTIAQLALVVNALCGIYILKDPPPKTWGARLMLAGCALATIGGIVLGTLK